MDGLAGRTGRPREDPQPGAVPGTPDRYRIKLKIGNRDLYGADFAWVDEDTIVAREVPADAVVIERREWGNLYGTIKEVRDAGRTVAQGPRRAGLRSRSDFRAPSVCTAKFAGSRRTRSAETTTQKRKSGCAARFGDARHQLRTRSRAAPAGARGIATEARDPEAELADLRQRQTASVVIAVAGDKEKDLPLAQIVRIYRPNAMGVATKTGFYVSKVWEFVSDDPRESNTEGGVFPAIFGTVMMVVIMSLIVTPLGVVAAFYLREYAKQGPFVSAVRIAVNNLAGVPSIVFGVFGVGFFYLLRGRESRPIVLPRNAATPTYGTGGILWASLTLALLTVPVVIVATEEGLAAIPGGTREASLALGATKFETTWRVVLPASCRPS